jgi:hypothetical protein
MGKLEGKRPFGRPRHRCGLNIEINLKEIDWEGVEWVYLAQDKVQWLDLVNMIMNLQAGNFLSSWAIITSQEGP